MKTYRSLSYLPAITLLTGLFCEASSILSGTARAAPVVSLSSAVGPPKTTVNVSGTGFGASALVDIYFDMNDLCLTFASDTGTVSCVIKVPKEAQPQTHWISAVQRSTNTGAQKAFVVRTDWTQFHGLNAKHTGFNPFENTLNTSNVANLDTLWQAVIGPSGTFSTPVVWNGKVYIGALDGKLYAFSTKTGAAVPGFPKVLGGKVYYSSPAVGSNIVYIGTASPDNKLYAFNASTGAAIAGFPITLGGPIYASSTLYGGNVYVACADGNIYAFNAATGAAVSGFPIAVGAGVDPDATVSAANGRIYEGFYANNTFYVFDATTGAAIGGFPFVSGGHIQSTAAIVSGQIFFGTEDGKLYGLPRYGYIGWPLGGFPVATTGAVLSSPAAGDGKVIVGSLDHKVYSYDPASGGTVLWSTTLDSTVYGSPIIANGVIYVNSSWSLYALNEENGAILWRASVSTIFPASPAVSDGIAFIGSSDGNLHAFSVNGMEPAKRLPGGELGIKPALSSLKPDYSLKASRTY